MRTTKHLPEITPSFCHFIHRLVVTLALAAGLLAGAVNSQANPYTWTNTTGAAFNDPNAWSPTSGPPGASDSATFTEAGTFIVPLTNNFLNFGTLVVGAGANNTLNLTLAFGTNIFSGLTGGASGASDFVLGNSGTSIVYIAVGTLYVTNSTGGGRFTIGRNSTSPAQVYLTNGTIVAQATVMANNATATPSKLVISGAGSSWTNGGLFSIGNAASANLNSLVISNSASMTIMSTFSAGAQGTSQSNSVLVDTNARLFTRAQNVAIGGGSSSIGNTVTVQGSGSWDAGGRAVSFGAGGGTGNGLTVGNGGQVFNITSLNLSAGNFLSFSNGLLSTSAGVTNTSGTVSGSGTIVGNVTFAGTGTLSLGSGTNVGPLTFSNNLTLVSGSTTILKLDNSQTGSNDQLNVVGMLTKAGTLTVITNGTAPLNIGDQYQLFVLGSSSGSFSAINLPSLDPSKQWNTSQLASAGILAVTFEPVVPGTTGLTNQLAGIGSTAVISGTVTGVPTPGVYWQFNNVNVTDGPQADGSTNSGSATATLTISNAQTNESGTFCLIATNSAGASTNCMALTVSNTDEPPTISGTSDQTVIQGNYGTFNAAVSGSPAPAIQWQVNSVNIPGATGTPLILTNVQFAQNGFVYTIIASNLVATASTNMTLYVIITPAIQTQPQSLIVTNTQSASFTVVSTNGVPAPTYQWYFNNSTLITGATNATYTIASASPANAGSYDVQISNAAGEITSTNATLTVDSAMTATLTPTNGAVNVCYDTPLFMAFSQTPVLSGTGKVNIYNVTNTNTPVDTIDTSAGLLQVRTIGTESFATYPVIITSNTVAIYPHLGVLSSNQQYYVTVDAGIFTDTNSALYAGITGTNGWTFTTKPTGPANPNNVVVAADGSGDFATVQGAVDSLPSGNTTYTLVNIRNGTYTEIVDTKNKNHITFRGQSRTGAVVEYANNYIINTSTHSRMAFKIYANDLAVENMTIVNTTPQGGQQAEALTIDTGAARFILNNAEVDSRQDTILANVNSSQGYFYNSLIQGNYDYIWGGGNLFVTNCQFQTIPTASQYNLCAPRTDNSTIPGEGWISYDGTHWSSNGISFVNCLLTRSSSTVSNITMSDSNGEPYGLAAWIYCHIDTTGGNGFLPPIPSVITNQTLWEFGNSNLDSSAAVTFGFLNPLTNGDARLECASSATCWLYGWVPQLAPNILTNPVSMTVTAGLTATFNVAATGIPDPSYQWLFNTTNALAGATNATLSITNALASDAGAYSVIVSNIAGTVTSSSATLTVVGTGPTASFTASPTSGTEPLGVTFTDTSSGSPTITLFWDFGDSSQATNAGGSSFVHTYAAGTYMVTLTASNAFGANSTLVSNNLINVVTAFAAWQQSYGLTGTLSSGNASYTGDGMSNTNKFMAGFNPTSAAAYLHVISVAEQLVSGNTNVVVTYLGANGDDTYMPGIASRTNVLDFTTGSVDGSYANGGWQDTGQTNILSGGNGSGTITSMTDSNITATPDRYYRVRVLLP
ncbi:MAG: pectinesterase family protein [Verrucomicrobiia bacterium]